MQWEPRMEDFRETERKGENDRPEGRGDRNRK